MEYKEFFSGLEMFGIKLGLERIEELFELLNHPENKIKFIHIAGTNGKGSVAALTSAMLTDSNFKVGLYTSPHLISIRERFRINGKAISKEKLNAAVEVLSLKLNKLKKKGEPLPSYFEVCTALAAYIFAEEKVDFVVWETGMGGRLDATNIVIPEISVITGISKDHTQYLGDNISDIAFEKAGIIKRGKPVICGACSLKAKEVILEIAHQKNTNVYFPLDHNTSIFDFQKSNLIIAEAVVKLLSNKFIFNMPNIKEASDKLTWPGRFQVFPGNIIVDGAHNPEASTALLKMLKKSFPNQKFKIIFASFADKNFIKSLLILSEIASLFIFTSSGSNRKTADLEVLELEFKKLNNSNISYILANSPEDALGLAQGENVLVCGSLYLAGEILRLLTDKDSLLNIY